MKYYYNGIKVKTSNNTYTHAVVRIGESGTKVIACCSRYDLAVKRLNKKVEDFNQITAVHERFLQRAIKGEEDRLIDFFELSNREELIQKAKDTVERRNKVQFKIVELEVKA